MINALDFNSGYLIGARNFAPVNLAPVAPISTLVSPFEYSGPSIEDTVTLGNNDFNSASDFFAQMRDLKQMALRERAVADLGADQLPADWATMPVDQFLNTVGQLRQAQGPQTQQDQQQDKEQKPDDQAAGDEKGTFGVNAHRYYDYSNQKYVNVQSVQIHEKGDWNSRGNTTWNSGDSNDVTTSKDEPMGADMQVEVTWQDGTKKVWDYTNQGQTVDVWGPNN